MPRGKQPRGRGDSSHPVSEKITFEVLVRHSYTDAKKLVGCTDLELTVIVTQVTFYAIELDAASQKRLVAHGSSPFADSMWTIPDKQLIISPLLSGNKIQRLNDQPTHIISKRNHLMPWLYNKKKRKAFGHKNSQEQDFLNVPRNHLDTLLNAGTLSRGLQGTPRSPFLTGSQAMPRLLFCGPHSEQWDPQRHTKVAWCVLLQLESLWMCGRAGDKRRQVWVCWIGISNILCSNSKGNLIFWNGK